MAYYFISIGGSGSKIMEALTHLCVAGILPGREELNVIALDPDSGNGNFERASSLINDFTKFQNMPVGNETVLFKNKIQIVEPFPWKPATHNAKLDDLMNANIIKDTPLGKLYRALYTTKERATPLNEGFRGHPSIGAAVLAQKFLFQRDEGWRRLIEDIQNDVGNSNGAKIFLSGSIFGGTGAAGIPTIARLLRDKLSAYADKVSIGGVFLLPYFTFNATDDDNSELYARSKNFLTNAKAALKYYSQGKNDFDYMYFFGDSSPINVSFSIGGNEQRNNSHIVELYAALAAADFFAQEARLDQGTEYKYICRNKEDVFGWEDFRYIVPKFQENFVQFARFIFAYNQLVAPIIKNPPKQSFFKRIFSNSTPPWYVDLIKRPNVNIFTDEVRCFERYTLAFCTWLKQIETLDGRQVSLIKPSFFSVSQGTVTIAVDDFQSCDFSTDNLTVAKVSERLNAPSGDWDKFAANDFGKLLRFLYESCRKI